MTNPADNIIGIVGGMGPYTGLDLAAKILDQSNARTAADQPSLMVLACPAWINDRTDYLVRQQGENPAYAILEVISRLHSVGARTIGIPCNTAHAPAIFEVIRAGCDKLSPAVTLAHMIEEVGLFLAEYHPEIRQAGILCTLGSYKTNVYAGALACHGIQVVNPEGMQQQEIHQVIYDAETGIKAAPTLTRHATRTKIERVAIELKNAGAQAIILGCTELPLVIKENYLAGLPVIDPTLILARALLKIAAPAKLQPFPHESIETAL